VKSLALSYVSGFGGDPFHVFSNASQMMAYDRRNPQTTGLVYLDTGFMVPSISPLQEESRPKPVNVLSISAGHDASIAISIDGQVQCVLELERLFGERYYNLMGDGFLRCKMRHSVAPRFHSYLMQALHKVSESCECGTQPCPRSFDFGVVVDRRMTCDLPYWVEKVFTVKQWRWVHHHEAHALMGFFSSPFQRALVLSYDGGGDDGYYKVFYASGSTIQRIARLNAGFGMAYNSITQLLPDIYPEGEEVLEFVCAHAQHATKDWLQLEIKQAQKETLSAAGKIMGYAAYAGDRTSERVQMAMKKHLDRVLGEATLDQEMQNETVPWGSMPTELVKLACASKDNQYLLAGELQRQWQQRSFKLLESLLEKIDSPVDGIVLVGGCALNVQANQFIEDNLGLQIFVPSAPNDCGLSVGGVFSLTPPVRRQAMQYLGFRLWDLEILEQEARSRQAPTLPSLGGVEYLAQLLASPHKPIVAVVRGRQEFGPRALGHRSLLAVPDTEDMKHRMNRLKFRKWYRPIAPMIAEEALVAVFGRKIRSRHMERAPKVQDWVREKFPAMVHFDGTARHQSVGHKDEPWIHELLLAVGKHTGLAALINTSFNTKGKPIVNSVKESLQMLDTLPDLDYVLIEDYLFKAPEVKVPLPIEEVKKRGLKFV